MTRIRFCRAAIALALSLPGAAPSLYSQDIPWEFEGVPRIVAIGDVHGAYERFVLNLKSTGLVDRNLKWIGGKAHLVQTGDVPDRGAHTRKVMDLLMALAPQAEAAGGRVHALIGNHDFWNVVGELYYVSPKEYLAFDGERDRELRAERGATTAPPGFFAHREAWNVTGPYGKWIRGHNAVVKVNGIVFVHGGITPEVAALGIPEINRRIRAELDVGESWRQGLSGSEEGPLMSRRYSEEVLTPEEEGRLAPEVQSVLEGLGARAIVMGHTVTYGLITPRFSGRAVLIDAGMLDVYLGGHQAALVIEGGRSYAVYAKGKVQIPPSLSGDTGFKYLEASAAASPGDAALRQKVASALLRQGRFKEAADIYFKLGVLDPTKTLPYTWRRQGADAFKAVGDDARAAKLYRYYLEALRTSGERSSARTGVPILNAFARESLDLGMMTEDALAVARRVSSADPTNAEYRVTLGWAYLEHGEAERAADILRTSITDGAQSYEAHFHLGRALARLNEPEKALEAFRAALVVKPGDRAAEEAMRKLEAPAK